MDAPRKPPSQLPSVRTNSSSFRCLRVLVILGRVSNLPTVWSNCLAAWLLAGGGPWLRFAVLCLGATLLYTGGVFLNDAFDKEFDVKYRPERPIPSGQISGRAVWVFGGGFLGSGCLLIIPLGMAPAISASGLLVAIVIYDAVHKRLAVAPALMGACRCLLYILAASVAQRSIQPQVLWRALALAAYVAGLSCLARRESTGESLNFWPAGLLLAPLAVTWLDPIGSAALFGIPVALLVAWVCWCLGQIWFRRHPNLPAAITGLLAGIVLVDWLAAAAAGPRMALPFLGLFILAKLLQRLAPAT